LCYTTLSEAHAPRPTRCPDQQRYPDLPYPTLPYPRISYTYPTLPYPTLLMFWPLRGPPTIKQRSAVAPPFSRPRVAFFLLPGRSYPTLPYPGVGREPLPYPDHWSAGGVEGESNPRCGVVSFRRDPGRGQGRIEPTPRTRRDPGRGQGGIEPTLRCCVISAGPRAGPRENRTHASHPPGPRAGPRGNRTHAAVLCHFGGTPGGAKGESNPQPLAPKQDSYHWKPTAGLEPATLLTRQMQSPHTHTHPTSICEAALGAHG